MKECLGVLVGLILITSCKQAHQSTDHKELGEHELVTQDEAEMTRLYQLQSLITDSMVAVVETKPVPSEVGHDAADDPAIWYKAEDPSKSIVYGSNKRGGIAAYDLEGRELAYYPVGSTNNIDILVDYPLGDTLVTLLGGTNRTSQAIDLFMIKSDGALQKLEEATLYTDTTVIDDIYGFCFGSDTKTGQAYAIINGKNGMVQQYALRSSANSVSLYLARSLKVNTKTEGMVVDQERDILYIVEEEHGIWMTSISPSTSKMELISASTESNTNIKYDIEGLTIYRDMGKAYLLASSQGNFSYAVFDINDDHKYLGSFKITDSATIDGAEETDGIAIVSDSLSTQFPIGMLVVQDGFNYQDSLPVPQNYKYVDVRDLLRLF